MVIHKQQQFEHNQIIQKIEEQNELIMMAEKIADGQLDINIKQNQKNNRLVNALQKMIERLRDKEIENKNLTQKLLIAPDLLHAQKLDMIDQLAGGIAHEFNNTLAVIIPTIEILKIDEENLETIESYNLILSASLQASNIVKQLLQFTRKESAKKKMLSIKSILELLKPMIKQVLGKKISLELNIETDQTLTLFADETQLRQVFINLALNAKDNMPNGGRFLITVLKLNSQIHIEVGDTGEKIPESDLKNIFNPFFTTKPVGQGTGLGLSVVQGIIKAHNGIISAHRDSNSNIKFIIKLPQEESFGIKTSYKKKDSPIFKNQPIKGKILLIDDDQNVLNVTRKVLNKMMWDVDCQLSVKEGLKIYRKNNYEWVILDFCMPEVDGIEGYLKFKKYDEKCQILLCTGDLYSEKLIRFTKKENIRLLYKPLTIDQFQRVLG